MTTTKKRVNITISKDTDKILSTLAKRDQVPQATKIAHLVQIAIESAPNDKTEWKIMYRSIMLTTSYLMSYDSE